jgi:TonB family protein
MNTAKRNVVLCCALLAALFAACLPAAAQYRQPPKEVLDVLNAPPPPALRLSPTREYALQVEPVRYPPIAELSQPMLRLAGERINPATNGPHNPPRWQNLVLLRISDGSARKVAVPAGARLGNPTWSPDGKKFAAVNTTNNSLEILVGDTTSAALKPVPGVKINGALGAGMAWLPDSKTLLCLTVPAGRGAPPPEVRLPSGPNVQENYGRAAPAPTYQDLLKNAYDEQLFDYYSTSQLALVDTSSGRKTPLGKPAVITGFNASPDGKFVIVTWLKRPYTYQRPYTSFPTEVEVWDMKGALAYKIASRPLAENVPLGGVVTGPRGYSWIPTSPSSLVWVEALDDGDPEKKVPFRDKVMTLDLPTRAAPREMMKLEHRFAGLAFGERGDFAIAREFDRDRVWTRAWFFDPQNPGARRKVWDLSARDRYNNPGNPLSRTLPSGESAILQDGDWILLSGAGASPEGDRPFLDRLNIRTLESQRIFRCDMKSFESVEAWLAPDGSKFLTRYESPSEPPNYYVRTAGSDAKQKLTGYADPAPQLRAIKSQLVRYKRPDGVDLSFTLYLPPDYKQGERRPAVVWAYPLEFTSGDLAGQVAGSTQRFTFFGGASQLFFLLAGYVVLNDASMPVVGDPVTVNNTYVQQIVSSAKAAIDKAADMGVIDPGRVGVAGHSYGAFMTANLLAHSDLFRAGIARSGAYNRTLTPFGFQSERRTFWQAREMYINVSPFAFADKITEPILLIHGEADNNTGTFPIQSERMFAALKGNGGNVRYVTLPFESHGYAARESIEHTLWEMLSWFDKHVKNAGPRGTTATSGLLREDAPGKPLPPSRELESPQRSMESSMRKAIERNEQGPYPARAEKNASPSPENQAEILTPTQGVDFADYLSRFLSRVRRNWHAAMPEYARLGAKGQTVLELSIERDGKVSAPVVVTPSGSEDLDKAALAAVRASGPAEELPRAFHGPEIRLRIKFLYNTVMSSAARN